jgi:signal peptidase I
MRIKALWRKYRRKIYKVADWVLYISGGFSALLLLWIVLQVTTVAHFVVPTGSMEPTLIPGDRILVNKWLMGARIFDVWESAAGKRVEISRLPSLEKIERNDVIVFNFPHRHRWDSIGMDIMAYYVKRCVALPGDTFEIRNGYNKVRGYEGVLGNEEGQRILSHLLSEENPSKEKLLQGGFPDDERVGWNIGELGPLYIPREGSKVDMTVENVLVYRKPIEWEQRKKLHIRGDSICLGDSIIKEYTFGKNYYFTVGDNVLSSQDSRYWGLLPEEYIVGKATRIFRSVHKHTGKERWKRFMKKIE